MPLFFRIFAFVFSLCWLSGAAAWSELGHRTVGELADRQLSPEARAEVRRILEGEAVPTLAGVATWADEEREAETPLGQRSYRWHWVNFPKKACDYVAERECRNGDCVIEAIRMQQARLANRALPLAERREALKFLAHFVGDVHQPFHAGMGEDRGGNEFQISLRGKGTNLHSIWDYHLPQSSGFADADAYADHLQRLPALPMDATLASAHPPLQWGLESCRLIYSESLYPPRHRIGEDYLAQHRPLAELRLRQAGARLAALLEQALAPPG
jgi:hypothetical protein